MPRFFVGTSVNPQYSSSAITVIIQMKVETVLSMDGKIDVATRIH